MTDLITVDNDGQIKTIPEAEQNYNNVKYLITKEDNPNPILICVTVALCIVLLYYIYVLYYKIDLSGKWVDKHKEAYKIYHNKWNDKLLIYKDKKIIEIGYLNGSALYIKNSSNKQKMGVLNKNNIYWFSGDIWKKPSEL